MKTFADRCLGAFLLLAATAVLGDLAHGAIPASERATLDAIYAQTGGRNWGDNAGWEGETGTECRWAGVTCDPKATHVLGLNLAYVDTAGNFLGNNLVGSLPALDGLPYLQTLYINYNPGLSGAIPPLAGLADLQFVLLDDNALTGSIPPLTGLRNLQRFVVLNNRLTGTLPSLQGLSLLQEFDAGGNQLHGGIPALTGLGALTTFTVQTNSLSGSIPSLQGLTSLSKFYAYQNQLTGSMPPLTGLAALADFRVNNNQLTGNLPALGGLSSLVDFDVGTNQLTGSMPSLTGLTQLAYFSARTNNLTGSLPSLAGLTSLQSFSAQSNRLTGTIPSLDGLNSLQTFNVQNNGLTGGPPTPPSNLVAAQSALCDNPLDHVASTAWDAATGVVPWYANCVSAAATLAITTTDQMVATGTDTTFVATISPAGKATTAISGSVLLTDASGRIICYMAVVNGVGSCDVILPSGSTTSVTGSFSGSTNIAPASAQVTKTVPVSVSGNLDQHGWTGAWSDPAAGGQGIVFEIYPDTGGAGVGTFGGGWFTYTYVAGGEDQKRWFTLQGAVSSTSTSANLTIFKSLGGSFDAPPAVTAGPVGTATINFADCQHGQLTYHFTDGTHPDGKVTLARADTNVTCDPTNGAGNGTAPGKYLLSGAWNAPGLPGQGLLFDINPVENLTFGTWYTYVPGSSVTDATGLRWYTLQILSADVGTAPLTNIGIFSAQGGVFNAGGGVTTPQVGTASIAFSNCNTLALTYSFTSGTNAGKSGTITLQRTGPTPAGCTL